jgi:hypothetical protein
MKAFELATHLPGDDLVYFVEDDYLHLPLALVKLSDAAAQLSADYVTLYDHPVRYFPRESELADLPLPSPRVFVTRSHHWQTVESTCMTFATRAHLLRADAAIFELHVGCFRVPQDRELFRHLQGLHAQWSNSPHRVLVGPIPSLATHCEEPWVAPVIDWGTVLGPEGGDPI